MSEEPNPEGWKILIEEFEKLEEVAALANGPENKFRQLVSVFPKKLLRLERRPGINAYVELDGYAAVWRVRHGGAYVEG